VACHLSVKEGELKTQAAVKFSYEDLTDEKSHGPSDIQFKIN
jgi:hypothetical protein